MPIADLKNLFSFAGGLGMFLYGMRIMGNGMQKTAGGKMNHFLAMVTDNRLLGVALGALITAILHSSAATTVMVVGFVNAGILNLTQAVGVIMGANIGTTITAWMVSLNQLGDAFAVLSPDFFAPLIIGIGTSLIVFSKKQKKNLIGEILVGIGLLFVGLNLMSSSISPYTDLPVFSRAFAVLGRNPILGIAAGAVVTALLQSSTASVGILQSLAMNGVVNFGAAVYITLGQNIGTCLTAMLSSAGTSRTAKQAAVIHLTFNTLGALVFGVGMSVAASVCPEFAASPISLVEISMFHTFFNVTNTILLFPFAKQLVRISAILVPEKEEKQERTENAEEEELDLAVRHLDQRIFESPALAIEIAQMETVHMGQIALKNICLAVECVTEGDAEKAEQVYRHEENIDRIEEFLTAYLAKVNNLSLSERQKMLVNNLFYSISDIERVGDHTENLAEQAEYMKKHGIVFSRMAIEDVRIIGGQAAEAFRYAVLARQNGSMNEIRKVSQYENEVDQSEEEMRDKHIDRLSDGLCQPQAGVIFFDIISNLERISDHAFNLAGYIKNEI